MIRFFVKYVYPDAVPMFHRKHVDATSKLVLLAGWGGSKRKNMRKLIHFYNEQGFDVISHTMPLTVPGFVRDHIEEWIAEEINAKLMMPPISDIHNNHASDSLSPTPKQSNLIAHIYSNNGAWVYAGLYRRKLIPAPCLAIWESSPSLWYVRDPPILALASGLCRVLVSTIMKGPIYTHYLITPIGTAIISIFIGISSIIARVQGNLHIVTDMVTLNYYLRDNTPIVPSIFIYSTGDQLIPTPIIDEFIGSWRQRGMSIATKVFGEDVPHTASFYLKTQEYIDFLKPYLFDPSLVKKEAGEIK